MRDRAVDKFSSATPIVVTGMHRSGTSLVTRTLATLGLFVGWRLQGDEESVFFIRLNDWILHQAGSRWDSPGAAVSLQRDNEFRAVAADYLRIRLASVQARSYLGPAHGFRQSVVDIPGPWGWKDPRNTLTLPTWLTLFPKLRVIHVARHGVDVANSLKTRSDRSLAAATARLRSPLRVTYYLRARRRGLVDSLRCRELEGGLSLWAEYAAQGELACRELPSDRVLRLRYEDFLANPEPLLADMTRFVGLDPGPERLSAAVRAMRRDRAYAYRSDPTLTEFAERNAEVLARHGYG